MRVIRQLIDQLAYRRRLTDHQLERLEEIGLIEVPGPDDSLLIDDLELTVRAHNCLKREGIDTVAQLIQRTASDLLDIRNMNPAAIENVRAKLAEHGLTLADGLLPDAGLPPGADWTDDAHDRADGWDAHGDSLIDVPPDRAAARDTAKNPHLRREVRAARRRRKDRHDPWRR